MAVKEVVGNLLTSDAEVILHQVNHEGFMDGGIAKQIKENLLGTEGFERYRALCMQKRDLLTGENYVYRLPQDKGVAYVINMFSQNAKPVYVGGRKEFTNYLALKMCLEMVRDDGRFFCKKIGIPGFLGCGIAGGDWAVVHEIIQDVFDNSEEDVTIYFLSENEFERSKRIIEGVNYNPEDSKESDQRTEE